MRAVREEAREVLHHLGVRAPHGVWLGAQGSEGSGSVHESRSPIDGSVLGSIQWATADDLEPVAIASRSAFEAFRQIPAPRRGELVRRFGQILRAHREDLATMVTLEVGKIRSEALGEVQEMIDICDFAVGLSRQLYGKTMTSERAAHRLTEQWHPLGPVGVITAFNFPVAVWAWNAVIALVCGDPIVWKPSEKTPLCALGCHQLLMRACETMDDIPDSVSSLLLGGADLGQALAENPHFPLISATGSVRMGRAVGQTVAARLGRSLLELGGNNGAVLTPSADLDLALRALVFAAAGTAGQRCTSLRRLIVHRERYAEVLKAVRAVYARLRLGDPRDPETLVGPLIEERAYSAMKSALEQAKAEGGTVHFGERVHEGVPAGGVYVRPALVEMPSQSEIVTQETFAPILYVLPYDDLAQAIEIHNAVPQGLSSAIFTRDLREAEIFCGPEGSDCGIVNVNVGTSGAEIGGAFGGEKDTGGGRESGSDAWKAYMRRVTSTVSYSDVLPLAQGVEFDVD
jgi:aldehyde dehydrogenase (NAD+)